MKAGAMPAGVLAIGLAFALILLGPELLDSLNTDWMNEGDRIAQYLGWIFYNNDGLRWPLGANPNFGDTVSNSIVYSDALPLLAIPAKILGVLSGEAHYFGWWLYACIILQALVGYLIATQITEERIAQIGLVLLILFSPPFLHRLGWHLALGAHFLILASICLAIRNDKSKQGLIWILLLVGSVLIHAYLFVMVAAIWVADLIMRWRAGERLLRLEIEVLIAFVLVWIAFWQAGYLEVQDDNRTGGFGNFGLNLLSVIDHNGWSHILPDLPGSGEEGFNYFGLGSLILIVVALVLILRGPRPELKRYWPLLGVLALLTIYSVSNTVMIGEEKYLVSVPSDVVRLAEIFRSSGRFFWPVFYCILIGAGWLVVTRLNHKWGPLVLISCAVIQVADTSSGWWRVRSSIQDPPAKLDQFDDPFWDDLPSRYERLIWIPPGNKTRHWQELSQIAFRNGMSTTAVYLARVDTQKGTEAKREAERLLESRQFSPQTLYVMDENSRDRMGSSDSFTIRKVDEVYVLFPEE